MKDASTEGTKETAVAILCGSDTIGRDVQCQPVWTPVLAHVAASTFVACGERDPNLAGSKCIADEIVGPRFSTMSMTELAIILARPDQVQSIARGFMDMP